MNTCTTKTNEKHTPFRRRTELCRSGGARSAAIGFCDDEQLFVEQRANINYYTPYKFSGKEKDEETSYSYFGARYYMSDVSIWLSVDPLWEKFPNISPFNYCHLNPVMLTDPDGMDDDVVITGNQDQSAFNDLQSGSKLPLVFDRQSGQVTIDGDIGVSKDPFSGALSGFLSDDDLQLASAINDHSVISELNADSGNESAGSCMATGKPKNGIVETTNNVNMEEVKKTNGKPGEIVKHEITEGHEYGKIALKLNRKMDAAIRSVTRKTFSDGIQRLFESHGDDYDFYQKAHNDATNDPTDLDHPKRNRK